jgi:protease IV
MTDPHIKPPGHGGKYDHEPRSEQSSAERLDRYSSRPPEQPPAPPQPPVQPPPPPMQGPPGRMPPPPPPGMPPQGGMPPGGNYRLSRPRTGMWRTLGVMLFIGVIGFNVLLFFAMFMGPALMGGGHDPRGVHEFSRRGGESETRIAVIPVEGIILEGGGGLFGGSVNPVSLMSDGLRRAGRDERVKAVVIEINSPGGGVTASDLIYNEIKTFRAEHNKPVVVYMKDVAASGGYYLAAPADYIFANRTTLTGSIGVVLQGFNFHGTLTEILKGEDATIKAGGNKTMGSMFTDPDSEEYREGRVLLQELADDMHELFKGVVLEGRGERLAEGWEEYADGRIFTAATALRMGYIDEIGYFEDAINKAEELAGIRDAAVVEYGRQVGLGALFGLSAEEMQQVERLGPAVLGDVLSARLQEELRLYPGRPMAIWIP